MEVLTPVQLRRLERHNYQSSGTSLLDPFMQEYWKRLVKVFPHWVAPNTITISGLAVNFIASVLLFFYCPTATENAPAWVYTVNAVGLFVYQSLDAIDGMQARRTGSASPLGELFDHGCDSVSLMFVSLAVSMTLKLGLHPWVMVTFCFTLYVTYYWRHWCAYVTGTVQFGKIDVTEMQIFSVILFCISSVWGSNIWQQFVPMLHLPLYIIPVAVCVVVSIFTVLRFIHIILDGGCGDNGATIADTSVISPGINIAIIMGLALSIASQSKSFICQNHPVLFLMFIGIISAKVTNRLVIAHLTRSELQFFDTSLLGLFALFLNQYFGSVFKEYLLFLICLVYTVFDLMQFLYLTYKQIASHLQVHIFSIKTMKIHVE